MYVRMALVMKLDKKRAITIGSCMHTEFRVIPNYALCHDPGHARC